MLPVAPGAANPIRGARFFVDGPKHGAAAGVIARLLGIDRHAPIGAALPAFPDNESWWQFTQVIGRRLPHLRASVRRKVMLLAKIAAQPEAQRISAFVQGGTPVGVYSQTQKMFCHNFTADPGAIPVISTYFLHEELHGCPSVGRMNAYRPRFKAKINAMARGIGNRPAVMLLELDAVGSSACIARHGGLRTWESLLHYEVTRIGGLPHTVVYLEGGYSDANTPRYAARILKAAGIRHIEGFYTNDTHMNWTISEVRYAERISALTGGAHFIVNTAQNGNGPKRNPHPRWQGNENLCNPPGRGLGPQTTTTVTFAPNIDALMWTHVPGNSSGCGGGPPGGVFWPARAIALAASANGRIGPHFASDRY